MDVSVIEPISPDDVVKAVPEFVIDAFNQLIQEKWRGGKATIELKEVKQRISKLGELGNPNLVNNDWLDVEPLYEAKGWKVTFSRPCLDESFLPYYSFKKDFRD